MPKYNTVFIIMIVASAAAIGLFILLKPTPPENFADCAARGNPVMESYPRRCRANGMTFTEEISVPTEVILSSPQAGEKVPSQIKLEGKAPGNWFFEAVFPVTLEDASGKTIASSYVTASGDWMREGLVDFTGTIEAPVEYSGPATLKLKKDNPSGLPENDAEIGFPVIISPELSAKTSVMVYFGKLGPDSSMAACDNTSGVKREVEKTVEVGKAAIEELLKGPTESEKAEGYITSIPSGVVLKSLSIKNSIAYAEFSEELDKNVGGSCRVTEIRAEITDTLKQFPTVKQVVISINGQIEDILQP